MEIDLDLDYEPLDTMNDHLVGVQGGEIIMSMPPLRPMSRTEALRMAAWLVALADDSLEHAQFLRVLAAIEST